MKPFIESTSFGAITIGHDSFENDVVIRSTGKIVKRKKRLSKEVYGSSHTLSLPEAEFLYEKEVPILIIGSGQHGMMSLSNEAKKFFNEKSISVSLSPTPDAIKEYNNADEPCIGLFHVTC
jgi:hypothetical protein